MERTEKSHKGGGCLGDGPGVLAGWGDVSFMSRLPGRCPLAVESPQNGSYATLTPQGDLPSAHQVALRPHGWDCPPPALAHPDLEPGTLGCRMEGCEIGIKGCGGRGEAG